MDAPVVQPPTPPPIQPVPPPPKKNSGIFIGILLLLLGIVVGLVIDKTAILSNIRIPYLGVKPTPTPIVTPTPIITNPNTGDLYQDIKVRMMELLP